MSLLVVLWSILGRIRLVRCVAWLMRAGGRRLYGAGGVAENIEESPCAMQALRNLGVSDLHE